MPVSRNVDDGGGLRSDLGDSRDHAHAGGAKVEIGTVCFRHEGNFAAYRAAEAWLTERGYSIGHMQRGAPCGLLHGDYDIQKWRNLSNAERAALDGTLSGDFRNGPVTIRLGWTNASKSPGRPK